MSTTRRWRRDDAYPTDEHTALSVAANAGLLANDTDPDASDVLTVSGVNTAGTLGVVTWNANGSFTYNPNGKFASLAVGQTATDTFTYTVSDGQGGTGTARVTITIAVSMTHRWRGMMRIRRTRTRRSAWRPTWGCWPMTRIRMPATC